MLRAVNYASVAQLAEQLTLKSKRPKIRISSLQTSPVVLYYQVPILLAIVTVLESVVCHPEKS